jgi:hypothetical protein
MSSTRARSRDGAALTDTNRTRCYIITACRMEGSFHQGGALWFSDAVGGDKDEACAKAGLDKVAADLK